MDTQTLQERIDQLHAELAHTNSVDPAVHNQLQTLIRDAQAILDRSEPAPTADLPLSSRFQESIAHLEADHPRLVWAISQIGDTLSRMGF